MIRQQSRIAEAVDAEWRGDPFGKNLAFMCGNCGERFASKGAKKRHKQDCAPDAGELPTGGDERCDDQDLYTRYRPTAEIKARAAAEWAAMDWRGRLPEGWSWEADRRKELTR